MANPDELLKKVAPRGKALRRTEKQLDDLTSAAAIESLAEEAQADFRENAPRAYKTLLDSKEKK